MSAILRAIRYADDASYRLAGYRKLDPITTLDAEIRFLKAAEALFFKGKVLAACGRFNVEQDGNWAPTQRYKSQRWYRTT